MIRLAGETQEGQWVNAPELLEAVWAVMCRSFSTDAGMNLLSVCFILQLCPFFAAQVCLECGTAWIIHIDICQHCAQKCDVPPQAVHGRACREPRPQSFRSFEDNQNFPIWLVAEGLRMVLHRCGNLILKWFQAEGTLGLVVKGQSQLVGSLTHKMRWRRFLLVWQRLSCQVVGLGCSTSIVARKFMMHLDLSSKAAGLVQEPVTGLAFLCSLCVVTRDRFKLSCFAPEALLHLYHLHVRMWCLLLKQWTRIAMVWSQEQSTRMQLQVPGVSASMHLDLLETTRLDSGCSWK